ncbi:TKL protein kinase [Phytophthora cinnamomi]|uniref:TKL protein kinase n=1 Tax=Phytophthora cinnamomi TaxID=4785 RepID=UPI003559E152|nr:TKL protein kinase [Phytophthora cinnamomi]
MQVGSNEASTEWFRKISDALQAARDEALAGTSHLRTWRLGQELAQDPYIVYARQIGDCEDGVCYDFDVGERASTDCSKENDLQVMGDFLGDAPYIIHSLYSDDDCSTFEYAVGFIATNSCLGGNVTALLFHQGSMNADGSAMEIPYYV